jgi:hypothetical protein
LAERSGCDANRRMVSATIAMNRASARVCDGGNTANGLPIRQQTERSACTHAHAQKRRANCRETTGRELEGEGEREKESGRGGHHTTRRQLHGHCSTAQEQPLTNRITAKQQMERSRLLPDRQHSTAQHSTAQHSTSFARAAGRHDPAWPRATATPLSAMPLPLPFPSDGRLLQQMHRNCSVSQSERSRQTVSRSARSQSVSRCAAQMACGLTAAPLGRLSIGTSAMRRTSHETSGGTS